VNSAAPMTVINNAQLAKISNEMGGRLTRVIDDL
jgi:hypothetical protein